MYVYLFEINLKFLLFLLFLSFALKPKIKENLIILIVLNGYLIYFIKIKFYIIAIMLWFELFEK